MNIIIDNFVNILTSINYFFKDWGISIIFLTVIVKLVLMPLSIKQKISIDNQQTYFSKMKKLEEKYKNKKDILEKELAKLTAENSRHFLGCLLSFTQLPIVYALYTTFRTIEMKNTSIIVPWVSNLNFPDPYYIIPVILMVTQLLPNILVSLKILKVKSIPGLSKINVFMSIFWGVFIGIKLPIAVGIYWIISYVINAIETITFNLLKKQKT
jgi:YidC/Oxa1 family membrane protein insertase